MDGHARASRPSRSAPVAGDAPDEQPGEDVQAIVITSRMSPREISADVWRPIAPR